MTGTSLQYHPVLPPLPGTWAASDARQFQYFLLLFWINFPSIFKIPVWPVLFSKTPVTQVHFRVIFIIIKTVFESHSGLSGFSWALLWISPSTPPTRLHVNRELSPVHILKVRQALYFAAAIQMELNKAATRRGRGSTAPAQRGTKGFPNTTTLQRSWEWLPEATVVTTLSGDCKFPTPGKSRHQGICLHGNPSVLIKTIPCTVVYPTRWLRNNWSKAERSAASQPWRDTALQSAGENDHQVKISSDFYFPSAFIKSRFLLALPPRLVPAVYRRAYNLGERLVF